MSIAGKHAYRFGYLKSEEWQNVRAAVLARDDARCKICGTRDLSNDIHHCRYPKNIWRTEKSHCITLCRKCHDRVHDNLTGKVSWSKMGKLFKELNPSNEDWIRACKKDPFLVSKFRKLLIRKLKKKITLLMLESRFQKCKICSKRSFTTPRKVSTQGVCPDWSVCESCWTFLLESLPSDRKWKDVRKIMLTIQWNCERSKLSSV